MDHWCPKTPLAIPRKHFDGHHFFSHSLPLWSTCSWGLFESRSLKIILGIDIFINTLEKIVKGCESMLSDSMSQMHVLTLLMSMAKTISDEQCSIWSWASLNRARKSCWVSQHFCLRLRREATVLLVFFLTESWCINTCLTWLNPRLTRRACASV